QTSSTLFPYTTLFRSDINGLSEFNEYRASCVGASNENRNLQLDARAAPVRRRCHQCFGFPEHVLEHGFPNRYQRYSTKQQHLARSEEHTSELQSPYDL